MSEETLLRTRIQYDDNAPEAKNRFDEFIGSVNKSMSTLGTFETEVKDFGSAMELAFEAPQRKMGTFFSLMRTGFRTMKEGGTGVTTGLGTMALAAQKMVEQVPGLEKWVPLFARISAGASTAGRVFSRLKGAMGGMSQDFSVVMRLTSDLGEQLRLQGQVMGQVFFHETEQLRATISEMKKKKTALESLMGATAKQLSMSKLGAEVDAGDIARLEQKTQQLKQYMISQEFLVKSRAEQLVIAQELQDVEGRLVTARQKGTRSAAQLGQVEKELTKQLGDHAKLTDEAADAQERLAVRTRSGSLMIRNMNSHITTARTALRHLNTTFETTGKVSAVRLEDARRSLRNLSQEMVRMSTAGLTIPEGMKRTRQELRALTKEWTAELKRQGKSTKKLKEETAAYNVVAGKTVKATKASSKAFAMSSMQMQGVSRALGNIHPALSGVVRTVSTFSATFTRSMDAVGNSATAAAVKVKAGMGIMKVGLIAAGAAAVGFMKKAGMISAEVTTLEITLRQVARNLAIKAGVDIDKFVAYVDKIPESLKGITTRESLIATTSFLRGVPQLLSRINELSEAAKSFGVTVADMGSSEVFGRFNQFIQSGNSALLKRLNIVKTASQMHEEYAATLGKNKEDLTAQEKIMARFEGVLGEVALTTGVYEVAMKTAGKQLSSMKRLAEEALLTMGKRFEPVLAQAIFGVNKLLKWFIGLSPAVHDALGWIVKLVAAMGAWSAITMVLGPALKFLVPAIKLVGRAIATALPQLLLIGAAIGIVMIAVKAFRKVWEQNMGGIQEAVKLFSDTFKQAFGPIIADLQYWGGVIKSVISAIIGLLTDAMANPLSNLGMIITVVSNGMQRLAVILRDVLNGALRGVYKLLLALSSMLKGDFSQAASFAESAIVDLATSIALIFKNLIGKGLSWGWNLIIQVANGIMKAAKTVIATAMKFVGNMIGRFIRPGSPPAEGPLSYIAKWGRGVMETFLRSFETADFGLLKTAMAPISEALGKAVEAGTLDKKDLAGTTKAVRENVAELISEFRKTGEVNKETMSAISDQLGEGGKDITEYVRRLMEHQRALRNLEQIKQRVAGAEQAGFVSAEMQKELDAAEGQVAAAEEAVSWQREFIAATQETVDLQLKMVEALEKMADAMEKMAGAGAGAGGEGDGLLAGLEIPDLPEAKDILPDFGEINLGATTKEFEDMRLKIQAIVDAVKEWFALPFDEKVESVKTFLSETGTKLLMWITDVTGFDLAAVFGGETTFGAELTKWLDSITGWDIGTWAEDIKTAVGGAWDWIVEKTKWLYGELVGASLIPDLVDETEVQIKRLNPLAWIGKQLDSFKEWWAGLEPFLAPILSVLAAPFSLIATIIDRVVKAVAENGPEFKEAFAGLGPAFTDLGAALAELWVAIQPIVAVIGIVLYAAFILVSGAISGLITFIAELAAGIVKAIPGIIQIFTGLINFVSGAIGILSAIFFLLTGRPKKAFEAFMKAGERFRSAFGNIVRGLLSTVINLGVGIVKAVVGFIVTVATKIALWVTGILEKFGILKEGSTEKVQEWVDNVGEVFDVFKETLDAVVLKVEEIMDQITEIWGYLFGAEDGIVSLWVKQAVTDVVEWVTSLWKDLVGNSLFQDIFDDILEIWDGIFGKEGYIRTKIAEAVDAVLGFGQDMYDAGKAIIENMFSGIKAAWDKGGEFLGKAWTWFQDQLPGSEPKDPASPFRDLEGKGAAIMQNLLRGMGNVDMAGAFSAQLAGVTQQLQASTYNQSMTLAPGAVQISMPGVRDRDSARGVWGQINDEVELARARGFLGGS